MRQDPVDRTRLLFRAVSDCIKRLDSAYASGKAIKTVFSYEAYGYRLRLKETLQKLMFSDPNLHTRKAEELIWRKVFYEPLHLYKLYVKNNDNTDRINEFESTLKMHLLSAIGYYQSLILYSQPERFKDRSTLGSWLPVPFHIPAYSGVSYELEPMPPSASHPALSDGKLIQKYLMYVGDLFRYLLELGEPIGKPLAYSYYNAALNFDPSTGLLHNQLGILDVGRCYGLNAIFHYLRCLCSATPFEGARRNLLTVLTKNLTRFQKLFDEKPVFGIYTRKPNRYRPKDFRKTITKFIYLVQNFMRPNSSDTNGLDPTLSNVFQDTLFELHLMLSISADLTLEPEVIPSEDGCLSEVTFQTEADEVTMRRHSSLFCERLTGPIFVRIALITLLTTNLRINESTLRDKTSEELVRSKKESSVERSVNEAAESERENGEAFAGSTSVPSTLPSCNRLFDPFGPLCFLLQLHELFMIHVCRQLDEHTPRSNQYSFDSGIKSARLSDLPVEHDPSLHRNPPDGDICHEHNHTTDDTADYSSKQNRCPRESLSAEHQELPLPASSRPSQSTQADSDTESDALDEETLPRFIRRPSDDDSGPAEDDEDDEPLDSVEADSSGELWSPDDSSLLHSQDDMHTSDSSSADELRSYVNQRLRRSQHSNSDTKRSSKAIDPNENDTETVTTLSETSSREVADRKLLDSIKEEYSSSEVTEHRRQRRSKERWSPNPGLSKVSRPNTHSKNNQESEVRYSKRVAHRNPSESCVTTWPHEDVENSPVCQSLSEPDIVGQAGIISRLYLLASIKLVLDWLCAEDCHILRICSSNAASGTSPKHVAMRYIFQRWCTQLTRLLNQLYPMFHHLKNELINNSAMLDDANPGTPDNTKPPMLTDVLSAFGVYAVRHDLLLATLQADSGDETADSSNVPLIQQTFPLPEDWLLRGLPCLKQLHERLDFNRTVLMMPFTRLDEAVLRISCLISTGRSIANQAADLGLRFTFNESASKPFYAGTPRTVSAFSQSCPNDYWHGAPSRHHPFRNRRGRFISRGRVCKPDRSDITGSGGRRWRGSTKHTPKRGYRTSSDRSAPRVSEPLCFLTSKQDSKLHFIPHEKQPKSGSQRKIGQYQDEKFEGNGNETESDERENDFTVTKQSSNSSVPVEVVGNVTVVSQLEGSGISQSTTNVSDSRKTQLMHDMARLRLITEVDQLARQCRSPVDTSRTSPSTSGDMMSVSAQPATNATFNSARNFVSPYLVLDAYCLCGHLSAVKELVNSSAFVLIIPIAVIAHLDYLKKTTATARVAIRYLEHETHSGNRFIRLQRPEEQPEEPMQLSRWVSGRKVTKPESSDTAASSASETSNDVGSVVNPRVVKRWLSVLDCAAYFSRTNPPVQLMEDAKRPEINFSGQQFDLQSPSRECSPAAPTTNSPSSSCCDLLHLNRTTYENTASGDKKTALVSILIGTREAAPKDTIVPQEFLDLVDKCDVRLELLRDFMSRWRRSRSSHQNVMSKQGDPS